MKYSIGFIGGGRITRILLQGFRNKSISFSKTVVADTDPEALRKTKQLFPFAAEGDAKVAAGQDVVFISLHPPVIVDTLNSIKGDVKKGSIIISLAPKISIARLSAVLETVNIARLIPNATSLINEGYNPVTFSTDFDAGKKKDIMDLLGVLGHTFEVPEDKLECYAIMSAMLPTYFWFQWEELAEVGCKIGLSEKEARNSIRETLIAAIDLMYGSGLTPSEVMDLIPVKPIGEHESAITEIYRTKLTSLYGKIRP